MSIKLVSMSSCGVNGVEWSVNLSQGLPSHKQGLIWLKVTKLTRTKLIDLQKTGTLICKKMVVIQRLFLPQIYKIGTLILQSVI